MKNYFSVRHCSPSDLEADLEDNQDYDSTVSQSETKLTIIGQASSSSSSSSQRRFGSCTSPSVATKPVNVLTQTSREKTCGQSLYASRFNSSAHSDAGRARPLGTSDVGRARPLVHGHTVAQGALRQNTNTRDGCNDRLRSDTSQNRSDVALITKNIHLTQVCVCLFNRNIFVGVVSILLNIFSNVIFSILVLQLLG